MSCPTPVPKTATQCYAGFAVPALIAYGVVGAIGAVLLGNVVRRR